MLAWLKRAAAWLLIAALNIPLDAMAQAQDAKSLSVPAARTDAKRAEKAFLAGKNAEARGWLEEALADYDESLRLNPRDAEALTRDALLRSRLVHVRVDEAEKHALAGDLALAKQELRAALRVDPGNPSVAERLSQISEISQFPVPAEEPRLAGIPQLRPEPGKRNFNLRGDLQATYQEVAHAFGLKAVFDPDLPSRSVQFRIEDVDFVTAMSVLQTQTGTFMRPIDATTLFVAADTPAKRAEYGLTVEQTFPLGESVGPEEMSEILRILRDITGSTHLQLNTASRTLTMRDSPQTVALASRLVQQIEQARGELLLDIELLEVDRNKALQLGITPPSSARLFAIDPNAVRSILQAKDLQTLLTLLQQIFGGQSGLFGSGQAGAAARIPPFVLVGGGRTTMLLTLPNAAANLSDALTLVQSGRRVLMRAQDAKPATFFVGDRFPITLSLLSSSLGTSPFIPTVSGSIFPRVDLAVGNSPLALAVASFTNSSLKDIAVVNHNDNSITVWLNQGSGVFTQAKNSPIALGATETGPSAIVTADLNPATDSFADLVVANSNSNTVSVLLGNGDGTFAEAAGSPFPTGDQPSAVVVADFNGDGNPDIAVANKGDNSITVLQGDGAGGFKPFPKSPFNMAGPLGIGTTSLPGAILNTAYAATLHSTGGTGAVTWSITAGSLPAGLTLNNSTGLISGTPTAVGTSSFTATVTDSASPPASATSILSIPVTAAAPSLAIATGSIANGKIGTGYSQTLSATGGTPPYTWSISSGSLPVGLALTASTGVISGTPAAGSFTFTVQVTDSGSPALTAQKQFTLTPSTAVEQGPTAMVVGDFRNSGTPALAVANQFSNNVSILLSSGDSTFDGTFSPASGSPIAVGAEPVAIAAGELNGDTRPDLAVANQAGNSVSVLLNNGDATFAQAANSPLATGDGSTPAGVAIADFLANGQGDIAVTDSGSDSVSLFLGLGAGLFSPRIALPAVPGGGPGAIVATAVNGAGVPDLVFTEQKSNQVSIIFNPSAFTTATGTNPFGIVQQPYPASEYVDLGLKIKATPALHANHEVTLQLEFEIRALSGQSVNGIPILSNRTLTQSVRVKEDQTTLIGGLFDQQETRALSGLPGFSQIPGARYLFGARSNQSMDTELLILVTPRQLRLPSRISKTIYAGRGGGAPRRGEIFTQPQPQPLPQPQPPQPLPQPPQPLPLPQPPPQN